MAESGAHILQDRSAWFSARTRSSIPSLAGLAVTTGLSVTLGAIILLGGDTPLAAIGFVGLLAVVFLTFYRLEWGLYIFLATVLLIDQFEVPEFSSLTYKTNYFNNINVIPWLPRIEAAAFSPLDVHLALLFVVWVTGLILKTAPPIRRPLAWPFALAFVLWLAVGFVAGAGRGGDSTAALWELRGLGYLFIVYVFFSGTIRTPDQVRAVIWVCIAAITVKAFEGTIRFAGLGFTLGGHDALLTHEDPIFFITLWILLFGLSAHGVRSAQRTTLWWVFIPLLLGFYAANRRAAFASLAASLIVFGTLLPAPQRRRILKRSIPVIIALGVYAALFWGSASPIAAPLNQIRSGFVDDYATLGDRNYYSNLYRKLENFNLAYTVRQYPATGIGFGTKYYQPLELVKINYALRDYMAHNNILWLLVKVGGIGFLLFWMFVNVFGARGGLLVMRLQNPYLKAVGIMIVVAVINQLVAAYFDLHLVRYRTMTYMGALMGLLPALDAAVTAEQSGRTQGTDDNQHVPGRGSA